MTKACNKCGTTKPEGEFYLVTQQGITRLRAICKEFSKAQLRDRSDEAKPDGRTCTQCGVYKPLSAFHKHKICRYGVEPMCKPCRLEKRRQYTRDYPERVRDTDLRMRYGLTLEQYHAMSAAQGGGARSAGRRRRGWWWTTTMRQGRCAACCATSATP